MSRAAVAPYAHPGFVPVAREMRGVPLAIDGVLPKDGERAVLLVADAATMIEQCRIPFLQRVPFGVDALWLDRADLDRLTEQPRCTRFSPTTPI